MSMICSIKDCNTKIYSRGVCRRHYDMERRKGNVEVIYNKSGYNRLDDIKDTGPGRRGYLGVNTINDIKFKAIKRGKEWALTHEQAFRLITSQCTYCRFTPRWPDNRVGIDRADNTIGYTIENSVPCCSTCNSAKGELTFDEFKEWINRLYNNLILKGTKNV